MDEKRLALIRYVSRHYGELHGLTDMAMALIMGSTGALLLAFGYHWWLPLSALGLAVLVVPLTTRYYSERYGRVRAGAAETWIRRWPQLFGVTLGLTGLGGMWWDQHRVGSGLPSVTLLFWSAPVLWHVISGWPFQAHRLLVVAAFLVASMMFVVVDSSARAEEWVATSVCLVSTALFVAGWFDHRLVVRALGDRIFTTEASEEHEPPR